MINTIVVHCSDSPHGRGDNAETIHKWHKRRGWDGIGYHWVILEDGTVQAGRPEYWKGAHCKGHNVDSIAICLVGVDDFTLDQLAALRLLIGEVMDRHNGIDDIVGHCDLDSKKTCPNFDVNWWWIQGKV